MTHKAPKTSGGGKGIRTHDPLLAKQMLYQLSYTPQHRKHGAGEETRTLDPNLGKVVLYQLSYTRSLPRGNSYTKKEAISKLYKCYISNKIILTCC